MLSERPLGGERAGGVRRADGIPQPRIQRIDIRARSEQVAGQGIETAVALQRQGAPEAGEQRVRQAFHQLVVLDVLPRHEMEDEIAVGGRASVQPGFIRLEPVEDPGVRGAFVGGAVAQVDGAAVVERRLIGAIPLGDVVMPMAADEPEVVPRVEPAAVMLGKALARLARLRDVAPQPKPLEPRGARTGGREPVEGGQLVRPRDDAQVRTIQLHRFGGACQARPREVGPPPVRRALGIVVGAGELQQTEPRIATHPEVCLEPGDRRVGVAHLSLHATARKLDAGVPTRRRGGGEPHRLQGNLEARLDALRERRVGEIDARLRKARVRLRGARQRPRGLGEVVLPELLAEILDRDHRVLPLRQLGEPQAVPRVGPVRSELPGPFELSSRVIVVRLGVSELPQAVRDEPEPAVEQWIVALLLRDLDRRRLEPLQRERVGHARE